MKRVVHPGDFRQSESLLNEQVDRKVPDERSQECAKLSPESSLLVKRVCELGWSVRAASKAGGMSDRRGREWLKRAEQGEPSLPLFGREGTAHFVA